MSGKKSFPSIELMKKETGRAKSSVIEGVRTLEDFGFVKKVKVPNKSGYKKNIYFLQDCCWNNDRMNSTANAFAPFVGRCGCGVKVRLGEVGAGKLGFHHYRCGDLVQMYSTRIKPELFEESQVDS
jgi:hypothetical protein